MELITEPARRALVITPHPDDAEGGCGATMGKWIKESGSEFIVVMCTNGDKGTSDRELSPETLAATREVEQRAASKVLGVKDVVFLAHPDGGLDDTMEFRGEVVRLIRKYKPDTIFCIDPYRSKSHTHRDHRMSGQVALDAAFTYAWSYLQFPEQITQEGVFQVVVDPRLADAVLTDRIDNKFLAGMNELFPLPKPEQADDSAKQEAEEPDPDTLYRPQQPPNRSTARSKGTLFLVDVKSRQVLWSTYLKEFYPSPNQLHKQARNVVARLKKQIASSME